MLLPAGRALCIWAIAAVIIEVTVAWSGALTFITWTGEGLAVAACS